MIREPPRSTLLPYTPLFRTRESLRSRGVNPSRIGVEDDTLPLEMRQKFAAAFPDAVLTDVSKATMRQRMVKSADRKSTRLNSSHANISYAVFCLKKKK